MFQTRQESKMSSAAHHPGKKNNEFAIYLFFTSRDIKFFWLIILDRSTGVWNEIWLLTKRYVVHPDKNVGGWQTNNPKQVKWGHSKYVTTLLIGRGHILGSQKTLNTYKHIT